MQIQSSQAALPITYCPPNYLLRSIFTTFIEQCQQKLSTFAPRNGTALLSFRCVGGLNPQRTKRQWQTQQCNVRVPRYCAEKPVFGNCIHIHLLVFFYETLEHQSQASPVAVSTTAKIDANCLNWN